MELTEFIGKVAVAPHTGERFLITKITASEIHVATVKLGTYGQPRHYAYETINADPFSRGKLVFEDASLLKPFQAAFDAHCRTEAAYWENYGYWMRRD